MAEIENIYMIFDGRPVKRVNTDKGEVTFLVWNWQKNEFETNLLLGIEMISGWEPGSEGRRAAEDARLVTQQDFDEYVEKLRQENSGEVVF